MNKNGERMGLTLFKDEDNILSNAIGALEEGTGVRLEVKQTQVKFEDQYVDAILRLHEVPVNFAAQIRRWAPHANLDAIIYQVNRLTGSYGQGLLVADYVNPNMAERLKTEHVQFIDTAGNAYINSPPLFIYVKGQRKALKVHAKKSNRAFEPSGLKVIYTFLCNPELVNAPYREIAESSDVALGTIGWAINGLKEAGFLIDRGRGRNRRLVNYQKLLDRWVDAYPQKLQPKQFIGTFIAEETNWWKKLYLPEYQALLSGETAAAKVTHFLKPKNTEVYIQEAHKNRLFIDAKFRKFNQQFNPDAPKIKVYQVFWNEQKRHHGPVNTINQLPSDIVHPVLIYADLIASGDARNREAAEVIHGEYIAGYCRED